MLVGRIIGSVTVGKKNDELSNNQFVIVQPRLPKRNKPTPFPATIGVPDARASGTIVAVDTLGVNHGDDVIVATGRAARLALGNEKLPIDAAIIAIVSSSEIND